MRDKSNMRHKTKKLGRPSPMDKPMVKVMVSLDQETIKKATRIGTGNLSAGIRKAVLQTTGE